MAGIGGCPNVGGICIGCTMPGFPDKFMPFMDEPPGAQAFVDTAISTYGRADPGLARISPTPPPTKSRSGGISGPKLTTGYQPTNVF